MVFECMYANPAKLMKLDTYIILLTKNSLNFSANNFFIMNNGPFRDRTTFDHSNTRLIRYSDPHCIYLTIGVFPNFFLFGEHLLIKLE